MKNNIVVFKKNKRKVIAALKEGRVDYVADSKWSFSDGLFSFLLSVGFFEFVENTYPSPRMRKNIPLWILVMAYASTKVKFKKFILQTSWNTQKRPNAYKDKF